MFSLAQVLFGIGKSDIATDENIIPNDTAFYDNNDSNRCVQTNIENDWILIEVEPIPNLTKKNNAEPEEGTKNFLPQKRKEKLKPKKKKTFEKLTFQEESWFVEPPECFKNTLPDSNQSVTTSSIEDLLIEHPSMSVFDNLFINRNNDDKNSKMVTLSIKCSAKTTRPNKMIQNCKTICKKSEKENIVTPRHNGNSNNKKKSVETTNSATVLTVSNQNKGKYLMVNRYYNIIL